MSPTSPVVANLEAALHAARADPDTTPEQATAGEHALTPEQLQTFVGQGYAVLAIDAVKPPAAPESAADTSGLPGGVDSAPTSQADPAPAAEEPAAATPSPAAGELDKIETAVEGDAIDIIQQLKDGSSISEVANRLLDQDGLTSIVKAIGDLSRKVL